MPYTPCQLSKSDSALWQYSHKPCIQCANEICFKQINGKEKKFPPISKNIAHPTSPERSNKMIFIVRQPNPSQCQYDFHFFHSSGTVSDAIFYVSIQLSIVGILWGKLTLGRGLTLSCLYSWCTLFDMIGIVESICLRNNRKRKTMNGKLRKPNGNIEENK